MKILPQLTDPPLKNGLFMSAIFTLNTRRGHVVRVSFRRSCPSRHATIGRTPVNGSHRDKESRNTAVPVRSSAERLPLRAMRSEGYRFLLFACCSAFSAPPSLLRDRFSGLFVAPPWSRARRTVRTGQCNGSRLGAEHAEALRQTLPDFLVHTRETHSLAKCLVERQDPDPFEMFRVAS